MDDSNGYVVPNQKRAHPITQELMLANAGLTRYSRETMENYLKRFTHLHLQGKKISQITNLDLCPNLKVLYLYDNQIEKIENIDKIPKLDQLYLNNNQIKEIPELKLEKLTSLHLEDNEITFVVGLDGCESLTELFISNQRLQSYMVLEFDNFSLQAIAKTLEVLDISGNRVGLMSQFMMLKNLRVFICENNLVEDISEVEMLVSLPALQEVSFKDNPVCNTNRYRDRVIAASKTRLNKLDKLEIFPHQKIAIKGLMKHRVNIGANFD